MDKQTQLSIIPILVFKLSSELSSVRPSAGSTIAPASRDSGDSGSGWILWNAGSRAPG